MKKLILSICTVFCLLAAPLSAVEWGGLIFNDTGASISGPDYNNLSINQADGISLWLKTPLSDTGFYFAGEALYKFKLTFAKDVDPVLEQIADIPLLKFYGDIDLDAGLLSLNAGRFYYVDSTTAVISQTIDGLSAKFALPVVNLGAFVGYTGLLNALNVQMAGSAAKADSKIYGLTDNPYLPLGLTFEFPSLFANQALELDAYYLLDLGDAKINKCYANLMLSGPITSSFFYNAATSFGFVDFKDMMNYSSLSFMIFPSAATTFTAGATFGSAAGQGPFVAFDSISVTSVLATSSIIPKLAFTYTNSSLYFNMGGNVPMMYDGSKYGIADVNCDFNLLYNIFSDFQIGFAVDAKIDLTGANTHSFNAKLSAALAF